jgi:predicted RNase H-like HicB family nuclease
MGVVRNRLALASQPRYTATMRFNLEIDREDDGRWIAEIPDLPGVMAYGQTRAEAVAKAEALALRVMADRVEGGEQMAVVDSMFAVAS